MLIAFTFSLLFFCHNKRRVNIPVPIKFYLLAYFLSFIPVDIHVFITNKLNYDTMLLINSLDYTFTFLEFSLLAYYFYSLNNSAKQKKILLYLSIFFTAIAAAILFYTTFYETVIYSVHWLYTTQVFFLLIPVFFYFKNIYKTSGVTDISKEPSFWISTGIAFFLLCTMSLSVLETFFIDHRPDLKRKLYPIYFTFYLLMFFMFLRAYWCKPTTVKS